MTRIIYALERPIKETGGPQHIQSALQGQTLEPANYSFHATDGTKIIYHVCGKGSTLLVSVCPGWGVGINYLPTSFKPLIDTGKVTFVAIQTRGSLPSEHPRDPTRMGSRHMADDMETFRQMLGHDKINILGHSNGGTICLDYAERYAAHCSKAVLVDAWIDGYPENGNHLMDELEKRKDDHRYAEAVKAFTQGKYEHTDKDKTQWLLDIFPLYFERPDSGMPAFQACTGPLVVQVWASDHQDKADEYEPEVSLFDQLNKVSGQVLFLSGQTDWICNPKAGEAAQKVIPDRARFISYPECGHMPWIEARQQFSKDVEAFLLG